jgi:hypothetical protein
VQIFISIFVDAVFIGIIFLRFARPQKRTTTIVFSNKAVIRRVNGRLHLQFRVINPPSRPCFAEA